MIYIFYLLANGLDLYSTLIQGSCKVEENPIWAWVWCGFGTPMFILVSVGLNLIVMFAVIELSKRFKTKVFIWTLGLLSILILLMGLTNLALIPYWVLSWLNY